MSAKTKSISRALLTLKANACGVSLRPLKHLTDSWCEVEALYRDETKLHHLRGSQASKSSIDLYSCAGKPIRSIGWDNGSIKGLGWSDDEKLIVVTADGTVRCYLDLQGDFTQFSLGNGAEEYGVAACRCALSGVRVANFRSC